MYFETAENYKTNRFGISAIEIPIELSWRILLLRNINFGEFMQDSNCLIFYQLKLFFEMNETLRTKKY